MAEPLTSGVNFVGCIDGIGEKSLSVWVDVDDLDRKIEISAERLGRVLDIVSEVSRRADGTTLVRRGFQLWLKEPFSAADLVAGRLVIYARVGDQRFVIPLWKKLILAELVRSNSAEDLHSALRANPQKLGRIVSLQGEVGVEPIESTKDAFEKGNISKDNSAIVGYNSHIFLYRGSNNVLDMYSRAKNGNTAARWDELIAARAKKCRDIDATYAHIMIPEKGSIMPELVPYPIDGPSSLWNELSEVLGGYRNAIKAITCGSLFSENADRSAFFRLRDSHLSDAGCRTICNELFDAFGWQVELSPSEPQWLCRVGDLGAKIGLLGREAMFEKYRIHKSLVDGDGRKIEPVSQFKFDVPGQHVGTKRSWTNENPLIDKRVICFGNSFFETGNYSTTLSWWCSRVFREFHFCWDFDVDWDLVERVRPSIVMFQTIERFLGRVPSV